MRRKAAGQHLECEFQLEVGLRFAVVDGAAQGGCGDVAVLFSDGAGGGRLCVAPNCSGE
jgi:hypothetical protein